MALDSGMFPWTISRTGSRTGERNGGNGGGSRGVPCEAQDRETESGSNTCKKNELYRGRGTSLQKRAVRTGNLLQKRVILTSDPSVAPFYLDFAPVDPGSKCGARIRSAEWFANRWPPGARPLALAVFSKYKGDRQTHMILRSGPNQGLGFGEGSSDGSKLGPENSGGRCITRA